MNKLPTLLEAFHELAVVSKNWGWDSSHLYVVICHVDICVWIMHLDFLQLKERNRGFYSPICLTYLRNVFEKEEIYAYKCLFLPAIKEAYGGIYIVRQIFFCNHFPV